ncbi:hypothetical protein MZK47_03355 [Microbacterium aerolatum]|uniref:hypothetical protein n=1 Tax=Microbacterium aerolatum TaxID=153731 RepID=UPI0020018EFD|nr:hypothetical protein [Microbacterium aerolatum]MCK3768704.1 hypothetical protein [Microbacterium aerolatum]
MTFFPPDPDVPEPQERESSQPRWWAAPEDEMPALFPASEILATTDHVAVALMGAAIYRDGIEFRLERRLRRNGLPTQEWNKLCGAFMEHHPWGDPMDPAGRLRFGLVLGDGERVFADQSRFFGDGDPMAEPTHHTLNRRGGGGGGDGNSYSGSDGLWLWPAPPAGPIELVMQWPAFNIDERRVILDGNGMLELVPLARRFWP